MPIDEDRWNAQMALQSSLETPAVAASVVAARLPAGLMVFTENLVCADK